MHLLSSYLLNSDLYLGTVDVGHLLLETQWHSYCFLRCTSA